MDEVPLDKALVDRFNGKVMAIVGFEADQVQFLDSVGVLLLFLHFWWTAK